MSESKKKSLLFPIVILCVVVFAGIAAVAVNNGGSAPKQQESELTQAPEVLPAPVETASGAPASNTDVPPAATAPVVNPDEIAARTTPRILGNPNAPVKISEHSSFTCGACAAYHKTNFKTLKTDYIDTGKAYLVFDDFPRNPVDIMVGSLARCLSGDAYFNFVQLLFETQADWANEGFKDHVKQNAMMAGVPEDKYEDCVNNKAVHEALAASREKTSTKFNINSTPQLVINDKRVIAGLAPYEDIKKAIEEELAAVSATGSDAPVPAPTLAPTSP